MRYGQSPVKVCRHQLHLSYTATLSQTKLQSQLESHASFAVDAIQSGLKRNLQGSTKLTTFLRVLPKA